MIITKPKDLTLIPKTRELALWLIETSRYGQSSGITVYVDDKLRYLSSFKYKKLLRYYPNASDKMKFWTPELCTANPELFDFIITLGGDGTVLFSSWLFQSHVPPVIPFHLGSLGFLTPFDFDKFRKYLSRVMENGVRINLRGRLTRTVYRQVSFKGHEISQDECKAIKLRNIMRNSKTGKLTAGGWCKNNKSHINKKKAFNIFGEIDGEVEGSSMDGTSDSMNEKDHDYHSKNNDEDDDENMDEHRQIPCFTTVPMEQYEVINELVVDRGPSPYVSLLELFGNDKHLTTVQADGLAISTPTGSTAYSLSAGGSLTHPEIRAILITPICPHTLSFRSTLVPDSMELRVCVPYNSRNTAWVAFDGRARVELKQGDHVKITASRYPFPTVCKEHQTTDWFGSVQNCLHWNRRARQKSFAVVESNPKSKPLFEPETHHTERKENRETSTSSTESASPPLRRYGSSGATSSSSSSDNGSDQVFGVFCDNDRQRNAKKQYSELDATYGSPEESMEDSALETSGNETDDEDDNEVEPDHLQNDANFTKGLRGWTEDEIAKGRIEGALRRYRQH